MVPHREVDPAHLEGLECSSSSQEPLPHFQAAVTGSIPVSFLTYAYFPLAIRPDHYRTRRHGSRAFPALYRHTLHIDYNYHTLREPSPDLGRSPLAC